MPDQESEPESKNTTDFGIFSRPSDGAGLTAADIIAMIVSAIWLILVGGFFFFADRSGDDAGLTSNVMVLVAIIVPVALIWIAAMTVRTARSMRAEARRLQAAIDAMRHAYITQAQSGVVRPSVESKLDEIAASAKQAESAIVTFTSRRDVSASQPSADRKAALAAPRASESQEEQPTLALGTPAEELAEPISVSDFIKAMNFPDSPSDKDGFRALRRALDDRSMAKLIHASQDTLTLLSQDGIYMDDLKPDRSRPEIWRRFAQGERGRTIAALGGVRDRTSLALTAGRMRKDAIFRDAAHHFLRQFDKTFAEFEKNASDADIADLSETRTARAFMLLGRVTGIFD
ncbi:MAG: hypothetical protein OEY05_03215 [Paracoccaceae bacterium]|nr:hypothetical protein [Paracoccaceae bacterium]MDH5529023.1 hypothetical protein [Paracoccaceae bacterium]